MEMKARNAKDDVVAEVHYQYNSKTGEVSDIKSISRAADSPGGFWSNAPIHLGAAGATQQKRSRK